MITSLSKLKKVLEPDEEYIWHAPLQPGSPGLGRDRLWLFVLQGVYCLFFLIFLALIIAAGTICTVVMSLLFVYVLSNLLMPKHLIVITNKRVIQLNRRLQIIGSCEYRDYKLGSKREQGIVVTARSLDGRTVHWLCKSNPHHISHLKAHRNNLLSS
jgi:hypothetical protein